MSLKNSYDIIVVGGGPAGCMAAYAAAKENVSVLKNSLLVSNKGEKATNNRMRQKCVSACYAGEVSHISTII